MDFRKKQNIHFHTEINSLSDNEHLLLQLE